MRTRLILSTLSLLLVYVVNYFALKGAINAKTIAEVSHRYNTLFAPANYAFAIWVLIYIMLALFMAYQWYLYINKKDNPVFHQIGAWFILSNLANFFWIYAWVYESIGMSVIIMLALLYSLVKLVKRLNMENWDAPISTIFFVWWPLCIYLGWIILATVANISAFIVSVGLHGGLLDPVVCTILLMFVSTIIYSLLIYKRNMREAAFIGIWGLLGIIIRHWYLYNSIVIAGIICTSFLLIYSIYHGFVNRTTSPIQKLLHPN